MGTTAADPLTPGKATPGKRGSCKHPINNWALQKPPTATSTTLIEQIGQASGNSLMHPPEHVVLGSVNHMFRLNHTPSEAMPQNEFIAISPDPCPWFTEGKGWQALVHGNHLRKRWADIINHAQR
jgi:hypothetical protein